MTLTALAQVDDPTVKIAIWALGTGTAKIDFSGTLGHRDPAPLLQPLFEKLHAVMRDDKRNKVIVDLRALRFMNSASFKHFVTWIKAKDSDPDVKYSIQFLLSKTHHWQEVSIHALSCFSSDPIAVEKEAAEEG